MNPYIDNGLTAEAKANKDEQLFLANAFLFYKNAQQILTDSRMFFAPVRINNGMTFHGTPGSHYPTLGMYIEWWLKCKLPETLKRMKLSHSALLAIPLLAPIAANVYILTVM